MDTDSTPPAPPPQQNVNQEAIISDLIDITIKTIDSKNFQFQVENDIQINAFKERIATQVGIEPESQRMIFCGRVLSDEKTLKDYNIDNGKTIHLVKKAAPSQRNNTNAANSAGQQGDRSRQRFHSYRSEDGSVFMGTISLDTPNGLINQMVRQLFTGNRGTASGEENSGVAGSNAASAQTESLRNRVNHIRRFLNYINTNFQILENPNQFPTPPAPIASAEPQVLAAEYTSLFREVLAVSDRLRPHLNNYFNSLASQPNSDDARAVEANHSILMRITHHMSHVMHLLSEFNVDLSTSDMPLTLNTLDTQGPISATTNSGSNNATLPTSTPSSMPNVSARIEISGPAISSASLPRAFSSVTNSGAIFGQSPIVLMEVDTNINVSRNFMQGLRNLGSFPTSDLGGGPNTANQPTQNNTGSTATTNATPTSASSTTANSTTTNSAASDSSASATENTASAPSSTANNNSSSVRSQSFNIPIGNLAITFDPYLACNSSYTIPEVRSAANINGINVMQQVVNSLNDLGSSNAGQPGGQSNPLFAGLNNLFQNLENSNAQSADEFEFFDLIRFLINQISLSGEDVTGDLGSAPRIGDYLRSLNLFNSNAEDDSFISELFNVLFENLNFEDLLHIVNSDFHEFSRFRRPLQDFIRNALQCPDWTIESVRNSAENYFSSNPNSLQNIVANIPPATGVDPIRSFQNFLKESFSNFIHLIMSSNSDETFEGDLLAALKYLVSSYVQFCRACFADSNRAVSMLITNYIEQYANFLNPRIRTYITNTVVERINLFSSSLEIDSTLTAQIQQSIVHTHSDNADQQPSAMQVETSSAPLVTEPDRHSVSNDSEVEFSDAVSDFPSTSATPKVVESPSESEHQNWQSIVPSEWVPIISEDINKQKNVDPAHQPPFSDAYLNGMPKKRRLEHKPEDDEQKPDSKLQRPQHQ